MKIQLIANIKVSQDADTSVSLGYLFSEGTEVTIGREIGATIAPLVDSLSRRHAKIYFKEGAWYVEDMGSTNGSFLDGTKISAPAKLANGSKLQFGTLTLSVDLVGEGSAEASAAPAPAGITPAEAAAAGAAAQLAGNNPTIITKPTIPGIKPDTPSAPVVPAELKPSASAEVLDDVPELPPVESAPAAPKTPAAPKSPLAPGLKLPPKPGLGAGLKLPPKPGLGAGLKLPPKPGLGAGLKLPPKPGLAAGIKLPPKPGIKLPPKG